MCARDFDMELLILWRITVKNKEILSRNFCLLHCPALSLESVERYGRGSECSSAETGGFGVEDSIGGEVSK